MTSLSISLVLSVFTCSSISRTYNRLNRSLLTGHRAGWQGLQFACFSRKDQLGSPTRIKYFTTFFKQDLYRLSPLALSY
jgi:hypothetical protein